MDSSFKIEKFKQAPKNLLWMHIYMSVIGQKTYVIQLKQYTQSYMPSIKVRFKQIYIQIIPTPNNGKTTMSTYFTNEI